MKTEITSEEYINIYQACGWDPKAFSLVLKKFGYSDELIVDGYLDLRYAPIKFLVNVKEVGFGLDLRNTLIQDLGKLEKVEGHLDLEGTSIQDLGNLKEVGRYLDLRNTPLSKKYSIEEISQMVKVGGALFF